MPFDRSQPAHTRFRQIFKERTTPIVIWAGAGASASAGLPTWAELRDQLEAALEAKMSTLDELARKRVEAHFALAKHEDSPWGAFDHLRLGLGETSWAATIRGVFEASPSVGIPTMYSRLWKLGVSGYVTVNLDRLVTRSFSSVFSGHALREFGGLDCARHSDVFRSANKFVANLHGTYEDVQSWVLTQRDFENLVGNPAYRQLIQTLFGSRVVLFAGISADDQAVGDHLLRLKAQNINLGGHYWLTHRNDSSTDKWAEEAGVNRIFYSSSGPHDHTQIGEFLDDLEAYIPKDTAPIPVEPPTARERNATIPPPDELERLPANEIRIALNKEAKRILGSANPSKMADYEKFWGTYSEAIYRAWRVSQSDGKSRLFDYTVTELLAKGAFGEVYKATAPDQKQVAVKVLLGNVREDVEMLTAFRRGVASMRILSERHVSGMVPYIAAWEIPTCTVMELIEGPNLEEAVQGGYVDDWAMRLRVSSDLARIVRSAHGVPERVLHRDLRPANVMLKNYFRDPQRWELVVLDFDLSWHRDAAEGSLDLSRSTNGYLAPEQTDPNRKRFTRSALVDSFGLGMTFYFVASRVHPLMNHHLQVNWRRTLQERVARVACPAWRSLPVRYARLIEFSTKDEQTERFDVAQICGELERLREALRGPQSVTSAELMAEEIMARCAAAGGDYAWDRDKLMASLELRSGFVVTLTGDESKKLVFLCLDWLGTGDHRYESFKKFIGAASDQACAQLKKAGWWVENKNIAGSSYTVRCRIPIDALRKGGVLDSAALALNGAIDSLRLK